MLGLQLSVDSEFRARRTLLRRAVEAAPGDVSARMALSEHLHRAKRAAEALEQRWTASADEAGQSPPAVASRQRPSRPWPAGGGSRDPRGLASSQPRPESYLIRVVMPFGRSAGLMMQRRVSEGLRPPTPHEGTSGGAWPISRR